MTDPKTPLLSRPIPLSALVLFLGGFFLLWFNGGKVKALFETADAEIDNIDFESTQPPERRLAAMRRALRSAHPDATRRSKPTGPRWNNVQAEDETQRMHAAPLSRDGYLSNSYSGGSGARDRVAALVDGGVLLNGETVKLEALTAQYHQPVAVPTGRAVALFVGTEHTLIERGGGVTHLEVGIQATNLELPKRPPLVLALALDISGSMEEEGKLRHALMAAKQLVGKLAPDDRLAIITYSDQAYTRLPMGPVGDGADALNVLDNLRAGGRTNLHAGLALAHLRANSGVLDGAVRRVLLLSDGEPTAGNTQPAAIREIAHSGFKDGVETSTLGVGLGFNGELMMGIASEGQGNYHFVGDAAAIDGVLTKELDELTHVVAQALRLTIQVDESVEILEVLGAEVLNTAKAQRVRATEQHLDQRLAEELGIASDREEEPDEGLKLLIPNFHLGAHHVVLLRLRVPPGTEPQRVARVELRGKDLLAETNISEEVVATVGRASDRAAMIRSLDKSVKKNLLGFRAGQALVGAGRALEMGWPHQAIRLLDDQVALLTVAGEKWRDPDLTRDAVLLGRYKTVVEAQAFGGLPGEARRYLSMSMGYNGYRLMR
jgi:Mg-chelatase subunit ChlD